MKTWKGKMGLSYFNCESLQSNFGGRLQFLKSKMGTPYYLAIPLLLIYPLELIAFVCVMCKMDGHCIEKLEAC